mgnify:CR=1 FL=1
MLCCTTNNSAKKKKPNEIEKVDFNKLLCKYRFGAKELYQYKQRFDRMAKNGIFTLESFRQNMGLLGLKSTSAITDRIFRVMDQTNQGNVSFEEFLEYMDVLINGSSEERAYQSFRLIAQKDMDLITYEDFSAWLVGVWKMYNALTGSDVSANEEAIKHNFNLIDYKEDGVIDFQEYKKSMVNHKSLFEWFDIVNKGLADKLNLKASQEKNKGVKTRIDSLQKSVFECIEIIESESPSKPPRPPTPPDIEDFAVLERGPKWVCYQETNLEGDLDSPERSDSEFSFAEEEPPNLLERLQEISKELKNLKQGIQEEEEEPMSSARRKFSTQYNVPKHTSKRKDSFIQWGDEDWELILNMMLGIQKAVRTAAVNLDSSALPTPEEFKEVTKHNLFPGNQQIRYKPFKFRDFAPSIFERIRRNAGIKSVCYIKSLGVEKIVNSLFHGEFSSLIGLITSGKSGSFFYYSDDGKYVLKTMTTQEFKFFKQILPDYYEHLVQNPDSLIPKFYGFHKIKVHRGMDYSSKYFVVMENVFSSGHEIHMRFDLKGSSYGRSTDPQEDYSIARKDNDLLESGTKIKVGPEKKAALVKQMTRDCEFFNRLKIIDYSLLVGIHNIKSQNLNFKEDNAFYKRDDGGMLSSEGDVLYFFGIIDIFTLYTSKKKLEHLFKGSLYGKEAISCIPPLRYSQRFLNFIISVFE